MRSWKVLVTVLVLVALVASGAAAQGLGGRTLEQGTQGEDVKALQERLQTLGYSPGSATGYFGERTQQAVQTLQQERGLEPSGVVDESTLVELQFFTYEVEEEKGLQELADQFGISVNVVRGLNGMGEGEGLAPGDVVELPAALKVHSGEDVVAAHSEQGGDEPPHGELVSWSEARNLVSRGGTMEIRDLYTGESFEAVRYGGSNHMDVEPRTSADTQVLRSNYGGSYSWARRPVVVRIGDRYVAASMNGQPHGGSNIGNNNFPGHFCLHFLNSSTHATGRPCSKHQAAVRAAAGQ